MAKHKTHTDWSLCPYTKLWCFGRKVGDISKCKLCDVEMKFKEENDMSRHTKYIQKMLNDLDSGMDEVISPDKLVKFKKTHNEYDSLCIYHYDTLILTLWENGFIEIGTGAYSDTDVRIINQVLEHYKMEKIAHRHKDCVYLE